MALHIYAFQTYDFKNKKLLCLKFSSQDIKEEQNHLKIYLKLKIFVFFFCPDFLIVSMLYDTF